MNTDKSVIPTALVRPHMDWSVVAAWHKPSAIRGLFLAPMPGRWRGHGTGLQYVSRESELDYRELLVEGLSTEAIGETVCSTVINVPWIRGKRAVPFTTPGYGIGRIRELGTNSKEPA